MLTNSIFRKITNSYFLTFFLLLLAFFLRFYKFDTLGLWGDEILTYWETKPLQTFNEIWIKTSPTEYVPPLYFYILNIYNHLFDYSAYAIRLFHIVFGFLSILIAFFISRHLLSKSASNLVLFLLGVNLFLVLISTEVRNVAFILFFYLILILFFFNIIKDINSKISYLDIFFLTMLNVLILTFHPFTVVIISAQIFFLLLLLKMKNAEYNKKIFLYVFFIILSCVIYVLINKDYILLRANGNPLEHHKLTLKFFIGYNFKTFFSSYFLGFLNLLLISLSFWQLKKNIYKNLYVLFLSIIFIFSYLFIIFVSLTFSGIGGARYWTYLVPIVVILNIYYLTEVKKNIFSKALVLLFIVYTPINYAMNLNTPTVRKPDTPGLIAFINKSDVEYIVSENHSYFDLYLRTGYKKILKKEIYYENKINEFDNDFLYLCLDLVWIQTKGTYTDEIYNCYPKIANTEKFKKLKTLKFNGYAITKYKFIK
ncbi:glycosyltransferase family 39 protein [Candidatus Pelagibacter sp.]|nr:glycosyltransferase family 39 protein [Candidatus Pelagibacter sp.]